MEQPILIHCAVKESHYSKFIKVIEEWGSDLFIISGTPKVDDGVVFVDVEMKIINFWEMIKPNMLEAIGKDNFNMAFISDYHKAGDSAGELKDKDGLLYYKLNLYFEYRKHVQDLPELPNAEDYKPKVYEYVIKTEKGYVGFNPDGSFKFGEMKDAWSAPERRFSDSFENIASVLRYEYFCEEVEYEIKDQLPFSDGGEDEVGKIFKTYGRYPAYTGVNATITEGKKIEIVEYLTQDGLYRISEDYTGNGGYIGVEDLVELITPKPSDKSNEQLKDESYDAN